MIVFLESYYTLTCYVAIYVHSSFFFKPLNFKIKTFSILQNRNIVDILFFSPVAPSRVPCIQKVFHKRLLGEGVWKEELVYVTFDRALISKENNCQDV